MDDIMNKLDGVIFNEKDDDIPITKDQQDTIVESVPNMQAIKSINERLNKGKSTNKKSPPTKGSIVESILKIDKCPESDYTVRYNRLKRMTADELNRMLAKRLDKGMDDIIVPPTAQIVKESNITPAVKPTCNIENQLEREAVVKQPSTDVSVDVASTALFNLNKIFSKLLVSFNDNMIKESTGIDISTYPSHIDANKEELMDVYRQIYLEHKDSIGDVVNPINRLLLINGVSLSCAVISEEKKSLKTD